MSYRTYFRMERLITPGLRDSQYRYKEVLQGAVTAGAAWLDLGCGRQIFPEFMSSSTAEEHELVGRCRPAVGVDYCRESLVRHRSLSNRLVGDIERLAFPAGCFDVVSANMVMEHVEDPVAALREIGRVLKPGGLFLFHTVNTLNYASTAARLTPQRIKNKLIWHLEGRAEDDVFPTTYRFNTPTVIQSIAARAGFAMERLELLNSTAVTAQIPPVAFFELALIRLLQCPAAAKYRSNIIGVLRRQPASREVPGVAPARARDTATASSTTSRA